MAEIVEAKVWTISSPSSDVKAPVQTRRGQMSAVRGWEQQVVVGAGRGEVLFHGW